MSYYRRPYYTSIPSVRREYSYEYTTESVPTYEVSRTTSRPYYYTYPETYVTPYSSRYYSTLPSSRTVIRSGPYGLTTRTYRY